MKFNLAFLATLSTLVSSDTSEICQPLTPDCKQSIEIKFFGNNAQVNLVEGYRVKYLKKCAKHHFNGQKCQNVLASCDTSNQFVCGRKLLSLFPDDSNYTHIEWRNKAVNVCEKNSSVLNSCKDILLACNAALTIKKTKDAENLLDEELGQNDNGKCDQTETTLPDLSATNSVVVKSTVPLIIPVIIAPVIIPTTTAQPIIPTIAVVIPVVPIVYDQCDYHFLANEALVAFNLQFNDEETARALLLSATSTVAADVTAAAALAFANKAVSVALAAATKTAKIGMFSHSYD